MEPNSSTKLCDVEDPVSPILSSDLSFIYGQGYKKRSDSEHRPFPESAVKTTKNLFQQQISDSRSQLTRHLTNKSKICSDQQDNIGSSSRPPTFDRMPSSSAFVTPSNSRFGIGNLRSMLGSGSHHVAIPYDVELRAMRVRITDDRPTDHALEATDEVDIPPSTQFDINTPRVKINVMTESDSTAACDAVHPVNRATTCCGDSTPAIAQSSYAPSSSGCCPTFVPSSHAVPEPSWPKKKIPPAISTTGAPESPEFSLPNAVSPEDRDYVTAATCAPLVPAANRTVTSDRLNQVSSHSDGPKADKIIRVNGVPYHIMKVIGQGGSCKVYEVYDMKRQLRAIKCVNLSGEDDDNCYINEIALLKKLQGSNRVIKLYDSELIVEHQLLYVVMERGDVDLATLIRSTGKRGQITDAMIKFYWSEMLRAVRVIHQEGIIHSDLKPSNFLIVEGQLKLIDFGISSAIPDNLTSIIKDTAMGTPSYMSPEALKDEAGDAAESGARRIKIGVKSDVWSLGCILYHIVHGHTPFSHIRQSYKLFCAIADPNHHIIFPSVADPLLDDVLKMCIVRDPKQRASIDDLLNHPYLTGATPVEIQPNKTVESLMQKISELSPNSMKKISQVVNQMNISKTT